MINENHKFKIGVNRNRAPWINSEKIRQLKVYARETEKRIVEMEKDISTNNREIDFEKQLLSNIKQNIRDQERNAIEAEFLNHDYFARI